MNYQQQIASIETAISRHEIPRSVELLSALFESLQATTERDKALVLLSKYHRSLGLEDAGILPHGSGEHNKILRALIRLKSRAAELSTVAKPVGEPAVEPDDYRLALCRVCVLQLLLTAAPDHGCTITEMYRKIQVHKRKHVVQVIRELEHMGLLTRSKIERKDHWKILDVPSFVSEIRQSLKAMADLQQ